MAKPNINADTQMAEILGLFPGAKRALFSRYHIGGCQSCAYSDDETLAEVCQRNEELPLNEVIDHIYASHEEDLKLLIEPNDLKAAFEKGEHLRLVDLRMEEEFEAVKLPGAELHSSELMQQIMGNEPKDCLIVVYDHKGDRSLDAASYFSGHGFKNAKALRGGIDAYASEVDKDLPRYQLEFED